MYTYDIYSSHYITRTPNSIESSNGYKYYTNPNSKYNLYSNNLIIIVDAFCLFDIKISYTGRIVNGEGWSQLLQ